jgi:hypothetical protein
MELNTTWMKHMDMAGTGEHKSIFAFSRQPINGFLHSVAVTSKDTHNADSITECKAIYYLKYCRFRG